MAHREAPTANMHETYDHPYVRVNVLLDKSIYVAGEQLRGVVDVASSSTKVGLGEISLELVYFQRNGLPPSNAVQGECVGGYWPARKGRCRFAFAFTLPDNSPSSGTFGGNAELKYTLKVSAQAQYNRERSLVSRRVKANVVERWTDWDHPDFAESVQDEASVRPSFAGTSGALTVKASVSRRLYWRAIDHDGRISIGPRHDTMQIQLHVRNTTNKTVRVRYNTRLAYSTPAQLSGARVSVCRRLKVSAPSDRAAALPQAPLVTETALEEPLSGRAYDFAPGEERTLTIAIDLPKGIATMRKTSLFEVEVLLRAWLNTGILSKELAVELPIFAAHAESVPFRAHQTHSPGPTPYFRSPAHSPILPSPGFDTGACSPSMSQSPRPLHNPYEPAQRALALPNPRPSTNQPGYLDFDPVAPGMTPSRVPGDHHRRSFYSIPAMSRSTPSLPVAPPTLSRPLPTPTPGPSRPRRSYGDAIDPHVIEAMAARCMSPEDRDMIIANLAPVPGYSGMARAGPGGAEELRRGTAVRRASAPMDLAEPVERDHSLQRSHSASNVPAFRPSALPPPLAPSSRFHTPPTVIPVYELDRQQATQALDTIGEAGESRLGTLAGVPSQLEAYVEAQELAEALKKSLPSQPLPTSPKSSDKRRSSLPSAMEIFAPPHSATFEPLPALRTATPPSTSEGLLALTARLASRPTAPSLAPQPPTPCKRSTQLERSSGGLLIAKASERSLRAAYIAANPLPRVERWVKEAAEGLEPRESPASYMRELPARVEKEQPSPTQQATNATVMLQQGMRDVLGDAKEEVQPSKEEVQPEQPPKQELLNDARMGHAPNEDGRTPSPPPNQVSDPPQTNDDDSPPIYDVRSARGGRGGVVTSVAAKFAAQEEEASTKSPKPLAFKPVIIRLEDRTAAPRTRAVQHIFKASPCSASTSIHRPFTASSLAPVALSSSARPTRVAEVFSRTRKRLSEPALLASSGAKGPTADEQLNLTLSKPATMSLPGPRAEQAKERESNGGDRFAALMTRYAQAAASTR